MVINEQMFPYQISNNLRMLIVLLTGILNFTTDYFNFLPAALLTSSHFIIVAISRSYYFEEPFTDLLWETISNMMIVFVNCWFIHLTITLVGMKLVEADILRQGND